ncbi:hypothetical protein NDU88_006662 [Pleurodeles waltl]|uniref:Uncharacterized protein n=1 Tax=Pleurodeles waltl TaxID=8319 RepID=A0AAV7WF41_PLEWA|nr:hypothetical protein NDU88_006662 [Pleurodeles waltl]
MRKRSRAVARDAGSKLESRPGALAAVHGGLGSTRLLGALRHAVSRIFQPFLRPTGGIFLGLSVRGPSPRGEEERQQGKFARKDTKKDTKKR